MCDGLIGGTLRVLVQKLRLRLCQLILEQFCVLFFFLLGWSVGHVRTRMGILLRGFRRPHFSRGWRRFLGCHGREVPGGLPCLPMVHRQPSPCDTEPDQHSNRCSNTQHLWPRHSCAGGTFRSDHLGAQPLLCSIASCTANRCSEAQLGVDRFRTPGARSRMQRHCRRVVVRHPAEDIVLESLGIVCDMLLRAAHFRLRIAWRFFLH